VTENEFLLFYLSLKSIFALMEFFQDMEPLLRSLWYMALPVSLVFIIQSAMTFMGADATDGTSADFDGNLDGDAPFQLFSFRNLVNFMLGFSWAGISFYGLIPNKVLLIAVALLIGIVFVAAFFLMMRQLHRLAEDNSFRIANTLHKTGSVYLSIPAHKSGKGKVQLSVNGAMHELDALTEQERIETGAMVRVVRTEGTNLVIVEKI
jgi:hypothetical protein